MFAVFAEEICWKPETEFQERNGFIIKYQKVLDIYSEKRISRFA